MKDKLKKWQAPKMSQLNIKETQGGIASQSEDYIKPNGDKAPGRGFGGAAS
ncbi:MAG TPA: hypothetical protein VIM88_07650 [Sulfurovum sp.]|uniref:hypothetical protein n=1 Tax=Sulfurovum sp. TaxID=1969726 RepID=UPI002F93C4EF